MLDVRMITSVVEWERRLELEEENRKSRRFEDVLSDFPAAPHSTRAERRSFFERIFHAGQERRPAYPCGDRDPCPEA